MASTKKNIVIAIVFATQWGPYLRGPDRGPRTTLNRLWLREVHMASYSNMSSESATEYGSRD